MYTLSKRYEDKEKRGEEIGGECSRKGEKNKLQLVFGCNACRENKEPVNLGEDGRIIQKLTS